MVIELIGYGIVETSNKYMMLWLTEKDSAQSLMGKKNTLKI